MIDKTMRIIIKNNNSVNVRDPQNNPTPTPL